MTSALSVRGLRKAFGRIQALDHVDLEIERGELVGFLGPNGAGKTTTMRGVVGLRAIDEPPGLEAVIESPTQLA